MPLYELIAGDTRRFYRIELLERRIHIQSGPIGSEGRHRFVSFETFELAREEYERLCQRKLSERFRLVPEHTDSETVARDRLAKTAPLSANPRFLFTKNRRFAWVEARGDRLLTVSGLREEEERLVPKEKRFASPTAAIEARDAWMVKLVAQGYELDTFGANVEAKEARPRQLADAGELEAMVAEDPHDDDRWSVLEDWLLEQDDPRADIIRFGKNKQLGDEAEARGAAYPLLLGKLHDPIAYALVSAVWRAGYVVECDFWTTQSPTELFGGFVAAPAGRLLRGLYLRGAHADVAAMCSQLAEAPCAPVMRELALFGNDTRARWLDARIFARLPLRKLVVAAGTIRIDHVSALDSLEELEHIVSTLRELRRLVKGTLPKLQRLALQMTQADHAGTQGDRAEWLSELRTELAPIAEGRFAPALRDLAITFNADDAAATAREIFATSSLQSLTVSPSGAS